MKRIKLISIGIIIFIATVGICATILLLPTESDDSISKGLASKMLALLDVNKESALLATDYFNSDKSGWYEKYMNYMYANKLIDVKKNRPSAKTANKNFDYGDLKFYLEAKRIELDKIKEITGMDYKEVSDKAKVPYKEFMEIYE